jgi:hypothetical protein
MIVMILTALAALVSGKTFFMARSTGKGCDRLAICGYLAALVFACQPAPGSKVCSVPAQPEVVDYSRSTTTEREGETLYSFRNVVSSLCLSVEGADRHGYGARVELSPCRAEQGDQHRDSGWHLRAMAEEAGYDYVEATNYSSGLCLGVKGGRNHVAGASLHVNKCGGVSQQWTVLGASSKNDKISLLKNRVSGLCIGTHGLDNKSGGAIEMAVCGGVQGDPAKDNLWQFDFCKNGNPPPFCGTPAETPGCDPAHDCCPPSEKCSCNNACARPYKCDVLCSDQ